jgi:peptidyl-prolyl cis-trans isomerase D
MLRFFAKFQRSRNAVLLLFCLLMLVSLVLFYAVPGTNFSDRLRGRGSNAGEETVVAKVGKYEITLRDYRTAIQALGSTFTRGNQLPLTTVRALGLDKQALDRLIADRLVQAEADRLGIGATDREVSEQIVRLPGFTNSETGQFIGKEEYLRTLALRGEDVEVFEGNIRSGIAVGKVRSYLTSAEQVSERDIEEAYKKDNTRVELVYALIDNEKVRKRLQLADADLRAYYDAHLDEFKANEPHRKVEYIFVPTDKVAETLKITDEELRAEYEQNKQYEPRVSIIKLDVLTPKDEDTVGNKIRELNQRVRGTPSVKAEDFGDVARGNSQDASAAKGGDIGFIKKDPNRANNWRQRAFNLKVGDIDGPFRDGQSWYLMKVTEQREVSFAEMRPTLIAGERNRRAYGEASKLADKAYEKFVEYKDIRKAAEEIAKELKVKPETLIRSTPFFKNGDTLPEIGSNPAFESAVGELKNKGDIGDKIGIPNGLAVPRLADLREGGQQLTFEEARNQVEEKVRRQREQNLAQQRAQEIITQAKTASEFEKLIREEGLEVKTDTNFNSYTFPTLQVTQQAQAAATQLKEGEVSKAPLKVGAGYLIFASTKRTDADLSQLAANREGVRQRLLGERQNLVYDAYLKAARRRYEENKQIKIYQDVIDKFFGSAAPAGQ